MRRGDLITVSQINRRINNLYLRINNITAEDIRAFSTGQILINSLKFISEVMSISTEQYFMNTESGFYRLYEDGLLKNYCEPNGIGYYLKEIEELEERRGEE